jgi:hypothetical protein
MHEQIKNIVLENAGSMVALKSAVKKLIKNRVNTGGNITFSITDEIHYF